MMKRIISLIVLVCLCLSCVSALAQESKYVTEWDLTQIYADQEAFDKEYAAVEARLPEYEALRGTISTPEGMLALMQLNNDISLAVGRMNNYAYFLTTLDVYDTEGMELSARIVALSTKLSQAQSFADSEIAALSIEERAALVASPELADYAYALRTLADERTVYLSEETNRTLATLGDAVYTADRVYTTLLYGDLPYPTYVTSDGEEITLDPTTFTNMVYSGAPREDLIEASKLRSTRYKTFANTFAACLDAHVRTTWDYAQLNNFDSTLEYAMHRADVDTKVYDMLVQASHEGVGDYQRYYLDMKRAMGLEGQEMYGFDSYLPATDYQPEATFDQSADYVLNALSVFGDEYANVIKEMLTTGHIDAFPGATKDTGAYSASLDDKILPFITMNYITADDATTLAHELGHSLYNYFSAINQPTQYIEPGIFTHEVASTTNEIIFYRTMFDLAQSDDERLYYLQKQIDMFVGTFFTQVLFAEFEDYCYKIVENGGVLMADDLNQEYSRLDNIYDGDIFTRFEGSETGWCAIPHFYYDYYVYNYASSVCYASVIANRIYEGAEGAKENYMRFLALGASVSPVEALTVAGVDPLDKASYDDALSYFREMLDQYEVLIAR